MRHAVVTTTIYDVSNLRHWASSMDPDDIIIVSGDQKTPEAAVRRTLAEITTFTGVQTEYVKECGWAVESVIGWNSIQRRNVAILQALRHSPEFITTVDTDNYPIKESTHLANVRLLMNQVMNDIVINSRTGWYNAGEMVQPTVLHRGFPLEARCYTPNDITVQRAKVKIGVHTSLWEGDPDINALERMLHDPVTTPRAMKGNFVLATDTWCPFNSQATTYRGELGPLLCVWPFVGRMDDIWANYVGRHIMDRFGYQVAYGAPHVVQERHEHDLTRDLENEIIGYRYTKEFVNLLRDIDITGTETVTDALRTVLKVICRWPFIPASLALFFDKWLQDIARLKSHYGVSFS